MSLSGYLSKRGQNWHTWKKRWVALENTEKYGCTLKYYRDKDAPNPLGILFIDNDTEVSKLTKKTYFGSKIKDIFVVKVRSSVRGRAQHKDASYHFIASSDEEMEKWIQAIHNKGTSQNDPKHDSTTKEKQPKQQTTIATSPAKPQKSKKPKVRSSNVTPPKERTSKPSKPIILVSGATGNIGKHAAIQLLKSQKFVVRAATRNLNDASSVALQKSGAELYLFDFAKPETIDRALEGVSGLLFITPFTADHLAHGRQFVKHIEKVKSSLKQIVKLSALGIEGGHIQLAREHLEIEKSLSDLGISLTSIRPNFFHQNFSNYYAKDIRESGTFYGPFGDAKVSFVDTRDVGTICAMSFIRNDLVGKVVNVPGPEAISYSDAADIISKVTGNKVTFTDIPDEKFKEASLKLGIPKSLVESLSELYGISRAGYAASTESNFDLPDIVGGDLITFERFVREHVDQFMVEKKPTVLVTGATGNVGRYLVENLVKLGLRVLAATRSPVSASNDIHLLGSKIVEFDLSKPDTIRKAVAGADQMFFVSPMTVDMIEEAKKIIKLVAEVGTIKHIVKLSGLGASSEAIEIARWHVVIEKEIRKYGIPMTTINPNNFFQNFGNNFSRTIKAQGVFVTSGNAKVSHVDTRDVAAVAAAAFVKDHLKGTSIDVVGPEAFDYDQAAEIISRITKRKVTHVPLSNEEWKKAMLSYQVPEKIVDQLIELSEIQKAGYTSQASIEIRDIIGRPPYRFEQYVKDHLSEFLPTNTILVIGATGNIGYPLIEELVRQENTVVRAATRNAKSHDAKGLAYMGAQVVEIDFNNPETLLKALNGVDQVAIINYLDSMFLQRGKIIVDAINKSGSVKHVANVGSIEMNQPNVFETGKWHKEIEDAFRSIDRIKVTSLRPGPFSQNIPSIHREYLRETGVLGYGHNVKHPYLDCRDIATFLARILLNEKYQGQTFQMTGPVSVNFTELAQLLSKITGKEIQASSLSEKDIIPMLTNIGCNELSRDILKWQADIPLAQDFVKQYEQITNKKLISIHEYLEQYSHIFRNFPKQRILITGANGNIGSNTIKSIIYNRTVRDRFILRAAVRSPEKSVEFEKLGLEVSIINVQDPDSLDKALSEVDRLFIVSPFSMDMVSVHESWINAAVRSQVKWIVKLGGAASKTRGIIMAEWHDDARRSLASTKIQYAVVDPVLFMSNLTNQVEAIRNGEFYGRYGGGSLNVIDSRDVAAVSAKLLTAEDVSKYSGKTYEITGPKPLTSQEMAQLLTVILKRKVNYVELTDEQCLMGMITTGTPEVLAKGLLKLSEGARRGYLDYVSPVFEEIMGRKPYSWENYVRTQYDIVYDF